MAKKILTRHQKDVKNERRRRSAAAKKRDGFMRGGVAVKKTLSPEDIKRIAAEALAIFNANKDKGDK